MTNTTIAAIFIGLILGIAVTFGSFGDMLIVALFGALGYGVAKIVSGDLDVSELLSSRRKQ